MATYRISSRFEATHPPATVLAANNYQQAKRRFESARDAWDAEPAREDLERAYWVAMAARDAAYEIWRYLKATEDSP